MPLQSFNDDQLQPKSADFWVNQIQLHLLLHLAASADAATHHNHRRDVLLRLSCAKHGRPFSLTQLMALCALCKPCRSTLAPCLEIARTRHHCGGYRREASASGCPACACAPLSTSSPCSAPCGPHKMPSRQGPENTYCLHRQHTVASGGEIGCATTDASLFSLALRLWLPA